MKLFTIKKSDTLTAYLRARENFHMLTYKELVSIKAAFSCIVITIETPDIRSTVAGKTQCGVVTEFAASNFGTYIDAGLIHILLDIARPTRRESCFKLPIPSCMDGLDNLQCYTYFSKVRNADIWDMNTSYGFSILAAYKRTLKLLTTWLENWNPESHNCIMLNYEDTGNSEYLNVNTLFL